MRESSTAPATPPYNRQWIAQANTAPMIQKPGTVEWKPGSFTAAVSATVATATAMSASSHHVVRRR